MGLGEKLSARMAHALYDANDEDRTEFRQLPPLMVVPKPFSEPMPVLLPSSIKGNWPAGPEAFPLARSGSELGHMMGQSGYLSICGDSSPECSVPWSVPGVEGNGFTELQQTAMFQRSMSSQSLEKQNSQLLRHRSAQFQPCLRSSVATPALEFEFSSVQSGSSFMRKVFSAGDLQKLSLGHESGIPLEDESFGNGVQKVARYNAEEKKERIQRYRSKRNHRNFTRKITYACRKTLADSRPRVRGRFAKNEDQGEGSTQVQCNRMEDDEDDESWIHLFDMN